MNASDRHALALKMKEDGPTWETLRQWALGEQDTLLADLRGANPNQAGELSYIQGRLSMAHLWVTLEMRVTQLAAQPNPTRQ